MYEINIDRMCISKTEAVYKTDRDNECGRQCMRQTETVKVNETERERERKKERERERERSNETDRYSECDR